MKHFSRLALLTIAGLSAVSAQAALSYAITEGGNFFAFEHARPDAPYGVTAIAGLIPGEKLVGIDARPANGMLYGIGSFGNLYVLDKRTGAAMMVNMVNVMPNGAKFGVDFNPVPDRLRVTSTQRQNLRINVDTGVAIVDGMLSYGSPTMPSIVASAYTNNFAGTTTTQLFNIDSETDSLVLQSPPNDGTLVAVGPLGIDIDDRAGFDIFTTGTVNRAFAALNVTGGNTSALYSINLRSGAATLVGNFRGSDRVIGFAVDAGETRR
ncbi:MAG: DUF4394 domain-containing protein [Fimbriimonadaceae bacterium]|nr:DUF4394 domain-containing protein [Fimbriimonadaceae bacterium]